jgi:hypothetical protein
MKTNIDTAYLDLKECVELILQEETLSDDSKVYNLFLEITSEIDKDKSLCIQNSSFTRILTAQGEFDSLKEQMQGNWDLYE